jgi:hypothetical protein
MAQILHWLEIFNNFSTMWTAAVVRWKSDLCFTFVGLQVKDLWTDQVT